MAGATIEGTSRFKERFKSLSDDFFVETSNFYASSIGVGTYLGNWDDKTDQSYIDAIRTAISLGCNFIDTAINYRFQRSERAIGKAIKDIPREEIVICTKAGYIPFDGTPPANQSEFTEYFHRTFGEIVRPEELAGGMHCMSPAYLKHQINQSLKNMGVETIDVFYIHNPEEQLEASNETEFYRQIETAFKSLEELCNRGQIGVYGTATWNGYRIDERSNGYLSLQKMVSAAKSAGGANHHFRFIQLPFNLAMQEAYMLKNQGGLSTIEMARKLGINVVTSASILQGKLARNLPDQIRGLIKGLETDAQRSIQFVRAIPGVTVSLVGMSKREHVEENLAVAKLPRVPLLSA